MKTNLHGGTGRPIPFGVGHPYPAPMRQPKRVDNFGYTEIVLPPDENHAWKCYLEGEMEQAESRAERAGTIPDLRVLIVDGQPRACQTMKAMFDALF